MGATGAVHAETWQQFIAAGQLPELGEWPVTPGTATLTAPRCSGTGFSQEPPRSHRCPALSGGGERGSGAPARRLPVLHRDTGHSGGAEPLLPVPHRDTGHSSGPQQRSGDSSQGWSRSKGASSEDVLGCDCSWTKEVLCSRLSFFLSPKSK